MQKVLHETCQQYVARRLSEGWRIVSQRGYYLILSSPDGNILRPVDLRNDVETLRPNAAGDETSLRFQVPDSTFHWDKVDEAGADENTTHVYDWDTPYRRDLYKLPAHSAGSGTINSVTIYFRIAAYSGIADAKPTQKSGAIVTDGTEQNQGTAYATKSQEYTINPATSAAYTWDEIDALQIGVCLRETTTGWRTKCTQVYVEVDYTPLVAPTVTTQDATGIGFD